MSEPPVQDPDVPAGPAIRLRILLALMRLVAGARGHSELVWWGQGFRYQVHVRRVGPVDYNLDADPTALGLAEAREQIRDAIEG